MMDKEGFDVYGDLEEYHIKQLLQEKNEALDELQEKYNCAIKQIQKLQNDVIAWKKKSSNIEKSFWSLLETSKSEIRRKDNQLDELKRQRDDQAFRRHTHNNSSENNREKIKEIEKIVTKNHKESSSESKYKRDENPFRRNDQMKCESQTNEDNKKKITDKKRSSDREHCRHHSPDRQEKTEKYKKDKHSNSSSRKHQKNDKSYQKDSASISSDKESRKRKLSPDISDAKKICKNSDSLSNITKLPAEACATSTPKVSSENKNVNEKQLTDKNKEPCEAQHVISALIKDLKVLRECQSNESDKSKDDMVTTNETPKPSFQDILFDDMLCGGNDLTIADYKPETTMVWLYDIGATTNQADLMKEKKSPMKNYANNEFVEIKEFKKSPENLSVEKSPTALRTLDTTIEEGSLHVIDGEMIDNEIEEDETETNNEMANSEDKEELMQDCTSKEQATKYFGELDNTPIKNSSLNETPAKNIPRETKTSYVDETHNIENPQSSSEISEEIVVDEIHNTNCQIPTENTLANSNIDANDKVRKCNEVDADSEVENINREVYTESNTNPCVIITPTLQHSPISPMSISPDQKETLEATTYITNHLLNSPIKYSPLKVRMKLLFGNTPDTQYYISNPIETNHDENKLSTESEPVMEIEENPEMIDETYSQLNENDNMDEMNDKMNHEGKTRNCLVLLKNSNNVEKLFNSLQCERDAQYCSSLDNDENLDNENELTTEVNKLGLIDKVHSNERNEFASTNHQNEEQTKNCMVLVHKTNNMKNIGNSLPSEKDSLEKTFANSVLETDQKNSKPEGFEIQPKCHALSPIYDPEPNIITVTVKRKKKQRNSNSFNQSDLINVTKCDINVKSLVPSVVPNLSSNKTEQIQNDSKDEHRNFNSLPQKSKNKIDSVKTVKSFNPLENKKCKKKDLLNSLIENKVNLKNVDVKPPETSLTISKNVKNPVKSVVQPIETNISPRNHHDLIESKIVDKKHKEKSSSSHSRSHKSTEKKNDSKKSKTEKIKKNEDAKNKNSKTSDKKSNSRDKKIEVAQPVPRKSSRILQKCENHKKTPEQYTSTPKSQRKFSPKILNEADEHIFDFLLKDSTESHSVINVQQDSLETSYNSKFNKVEKDIQLLFGNTPQKQMPNSQEQSTNQQTVDSTNCPSNSPNDTQNCELNNNSTLNSSVTILKKFSTSSKDYQMEYDEKQGVTSWVITRKKKRKITT